MAINWYPGHMHKARKDMVKIMSKIDVIIELVDARIPWSSQNPIIGEWRGQKPTIVVLTKADLADDNLTARWQAYFEQQDGIKTLDYSPERKERLQQIQSLCLKLAPARDGFKPVNAMITGIPNVGKSSLINALAERMVAKTGDEPAVTKHQQKISLDSKLVLHDTPGMLWPKIENPDSGYRLAMVGSIKNTAVDFEELGCFAAAYLQQCYPHILQQRYSLDALPEEDWQVLEAIGAKRGAKQAGGRVNLHKASELLLHDFRQFKLGKITLESPQMIAAEWQKVEQEKLRKEELKQARKNKTKSRLRD